MDPKKVKMTIAMPCHDSVKARTVSSLFGADLPFPTTLAMEFGPYVHINREKLANRAIADGSTHLFFLDSDMLFPPNAIRALVEQDKDIIGASYNCRTLPPVTTVKFREGTDPGVFKSDIVVATEPFIAGAVATGFLLIKTHVFQKIPKPWFWYERRGEGVYVGEDIWFCIEAAKAGFEIWCDPTLKVKHLGDFAY